MTEHQLQLGIHGFQWIDIFSCSKCKYEKCKKRSFNGGCLVTVLNDVGKKEVFIFTEKGKIKRRSKP